MEKYCETNQRASKENPSDPSYAAKTDQEKIRFAIFYYETEYFKSTAEMRETTWGIDDPYKAKKINQIIICKHPYTGSKSWPQMIVVKTKYCYCFARIEDISLIIFGESDSFSWPLSLCLKIRSLRHVLSLLMCLEEQSLLALYQQRTFNIYRDNSIYPLTVRSTKKGEASTLSVMLDSARPRMYFFRSKTKII